MIEEYYEARGLDPSGVLRPEQMSELRLGVRSDLRITTQAVA